MGEQGSGTGWEVAEYIARRRGVSDGENNESPRECTRSCRWCCGSVEKKQTHLVRQGKRDQATCGLHSEVAAAASAAAVAAAAAAANADATAAGVADAENAAAADAGNAAAAVFAAASLAPDAVAGIEDAEGAVNAAIGVLGELQFCVAALHCCVCSYLSSYPLCGCRVSRRELLD